MEKTVSVFVGKTGCHHWLLGPPSSKNHKSRSQHPKVLLLHAMRHLPCAVGIAEDTNQWRRAQQRKDPVLYMNNVVKKQAAVRPTADNMLVIFNLPRVQLLLESSGIWWCRSSSQHCGI